MISPKCGTTKSSGRRGASRTGACSPRTAPCGSHGGSASREGASDSVLRRQGGGAVPVLGQGHGGPGVVQRQLPTLDAVH